MRLCASYCNHNCCALRVSFAWAVIDRRDPLLAVRSSAMGLYRYYGALHTASMLVPSCPFLPESSCNMSYRAMRQARLSDNWDMHYYQALQYAQFLWQDGRAGRALLALARGLYCSDAVSDRRILEQWPLPYQAMAWIVVSQDAEDFPGNPLLSFYNQASRMPAHFPPSRQWRAWAVWAVIDAVRPQLASSRIDRGAAPSVLQIECQLKRCGLMGEWQVWRAVLAWDVATG